MKALYTIATLLGAGAFLYTGFVITKWFVVVPLINLIVGE